MEDLNRDGFVREFGDFLDRHQISALSAAKAIGCSEMTMNRLLGNIEPSTLPTDEMLKQAGCMMALNYTRYSKLSRAEKRQLSETIGTVVGGSLGFAAITTTISGSGVAGLSAAGISSGLASMGGIIGGGMAAGVAVAATLPIAIGGAGFGIVKVAKYLRVQKSLKSTHLDSNWEIMRGN
jgi:hypothetical protein